MRKFLLVIVCAICSVTVYGYDFQNNGIYYNKLSDNQVEVTYLDLKRANANAYTGDVVIPATVTHEATTYRVVAVGDLAFDMCWKVTSVTLPQGIVRIGEMAFMNCTAVTSITIPDSVTELGVAAFSGCRELKAINIPNGITSIAERLCNGCSSLTSIKIPDTVTIIDKAAFSGCSSLKSVVIPDNVTTICERAFSSCSSLTSVTMPNTLSVIKDRAFASSGLTSVKIPDQIESISSTAFHGCKELPFDKIEFANNGSRGEVNGHQWVDLGLPSGKKWATCNIGASSPEQSGWYLSWAEMEEKSSYEPKVSKTYEQRVGDISGNSNYDVAAARWGGGWRMPTIDEWRELAKYCRWESVIINGKDVKRIVSKVNGNFIFLPHSGHKTLSKSEEINVRGKYWSSTPQQGSTVRTQTLSFFATGGADYSTEYLGTGLTVRAIID